MGNFGKNKNSSIDFGIKIFPENEKTYEKNFEGFFFRFSFLHSNFYFGMFSVRFG